jgi:hypothetical protein
MDFEPLIEGIARFIRVGEKDAGRAASVEGWLGKLSLPEKQVPLIHDYLRGASALEEAQRTGSPRVQGIDVPMWQSLQTKLEQQVQSDPEVQNSLKNLYVNSKTPPDPEVTSSIVEPRRAAPVAGAAPAIAPITAPTAEQRAPGQPANFGRAGSVEVPESTSPMPQFKPARALPAQDALALKQKEHAWQEFATATETRDPVQMEAAHERISGLHSMDEGPRGTDPAWKRTLGYMTSLEAEMEKWAQTGIKNDAWTRSLEKFKEQSGIDEVSMPSYMRKTVDRFEAWVDAQKPPTNWDRFKQALGVPRTIMSSIDFSAPGRQGILMMARPEYWSNLRHMFEALDEAKYNESQAYIRNHPDYEMAQKGGLAITNINDHLTPQEEAFQSKLAEKIPGVKASERAYTTYLNRLRFDVFSNELRKAAAAGVPLDSQFVDSLAEWVNTFTGRGGGKKFNPGVLSTILFSPRLAMARAQTLNPGYYAGMHPFVRQQAIKTGLAAAASIVGLVSLAGMSGAKVTWDFRNPDAGKVRVGNTRIDLGGGMFQFIRLFTQLATNQKVNSETGQVQELGAKFGAKNRLDVLTQFVISKEAPVASFVTDLLRGKDMAGHKFSMKNEVLQRMVPLAMQDIYEVLKDKGVEGLAYSIPAVFGVGLQTYSTPPHQETVPFMGVKGQVPVELSKSYAQAILDADKRATVTALERSKNMSPMQQKLVLRNAIKAERLKARAAWIRANVEAYRNAKRAGEATVPLVAPGGVQ